jgi:hypothetical protein
MVNYDLPWNPNRIEQRFGRVHRIGQEHVCRLWNLVASNTREGEVFLRLLDKVDEQRKAYGGKVFDVLGTAFVEKPLRDLLIEAIRYGEQPEVRARMHEVIDSHVGDGLRELLEERALASQQLSDSDLASLQATVDDARARRLRPVDVEAAFRTAFTMLGGRIVKREAGRFEIDHVPHRVQQRTNAPIASRYSRVAFGLDHIQPEGLPRADLVAPGHPLYDAVIDEAISAFAGVLNQGTVLVSPAIRETRLLMGIMEEVVDGAGEQVARRFGYVWVDKQGTVVPAGPAPHLDCVEAPDTPATQAARMLPWLVDVEARAISWIIEHRLPDYVAETQARRAGEIAKKRRLVEERLAAERTRLLNESSDAVHKERMGEKVKESSDGLARKASDLQVRLDRRLKVLGLQERLSTKQPLAIVVALVLPIE